MKAFFSICLISLIFASCGAEKRLARKQARCNKLFPPEVIIDSVVTIDSIVTTDTVVVVKDTTIVIPGDTVKITRTIDCDSLGRVNMARTTVASTSGGVSATVSITNNQLEVECKTDSLELEIERYKVQIKELKEINRNARVEVTKREIRKEKYIPSFYQFTYWWFWITAGILLLLIILRWLLGRKLL